MKLLKLCCVNILIFVLIFEVGARLVLRDELSLGILADERNLNFAYDAELGWFPRPNARNQLSGSRVIQVVNNSTGFRDHEYQEKRLPRIAFLGDSFVWGYDVEQNERFTEILQSQLTHLEVMNWGISGFGTDQEFLLLQRFFEKLMPDIVVLVFNANNDREDNTTNLRYSGYFKPYFSACEKSLCLSGVPVRKAVKYSFRSVSGVFEYSYLLRAFAVLVNRIGNLSRIEVGDPTEFLISQMREFVEKRGSRFIVAIAISDAEILPFLQRENFEHVVLENSFVYSEYGKHWTPEGHAFVASKFLPLIVQEEIGRKVQNSDI